MFDEVCPADPFVYDLLRRDLLVLFEEGIELVAVEGGTFDVIEEGDILERSDLEEACGH